MRIPSDIYGQVYAETWALGDWPSGFAHEGSSINVSSAGRETGVEGWYLDIDMFGCKGLAGDLDDIVGRSGNIVKRALTLLKRIAVLGRGFLRLQGQVGCNGQLWKEHD